MLSERLACHWRTKAWITVALPVYFALFYFGVQRVSLFEIGIVSSTIFDELTPFDPRWTVVYQSLYLCLPLPWLCRSARELRRYVVGFFLLTAPAFFVFFVFPTSGPRPAAMPDHFLYQTVVAYDRNVNAFPSLHVALTVYTLCLAFRLRPRRAVKAVMILWTSLVVYSTMATKQHWMADVVAGVALALAADYFGGLIVREERKNVYDPSPAWIDPPSHGEHHSLPLGR